MTIDSNDKRYLTKVRDGVAPRTWWSADEFGQNKQEERDHVNILINYIECHFFDQLASKKDRHISAFCFLLISDKRTYCMPNA